MSEKIYLSTPNICGNEWKYIKDCLDSGWVSSIGDYVNLFENKICEFTKSKYAVACVNATSALHISLLLSGVKEGEEVIVPTVTFIAPINTVRYINANPVFMDCDRYYNIDSEKTIDFIKKETFFKGGKTYNKKTKKRIAAIILVHVFGNAVFLDDLYSICKERNVKIIEDSAESLGTTYNEGIFRGFHTGTIGDFGCLSFNGNKIITTGGGGMILTQRQDLAEKAFYYTTQAKDDRIYFIHKNVGYNYRLTNVQAAMGVAQLENLDKFIAKKRKNYFIYKEKINKLQGLKIADIPFYARNNCWMYALQFDYKKNNFKKRLITYLQKNNIQTRPLWYLNHLQRPFLKYQNYKIEKALELYKKTLNIPCSTNLTEKHITKVVSKLKLFINDIR